MAQQSTLEFLVAAQVTGQEQIARLINDTDKLNKTTKGLQTAFSQMGGAAKSLSDVQKNAAAIDAARAEKLARLSQEFYNSALSIDRTAKSARDSASAFEEAFAAQERVAKAQRDAAAAAADLRAKLDPMIPIQNRFNAEMDHAADLLRMGAISQKEYAAATTLARQNLYSAQQALHGMNAAQSGVIINGVRYNSMADAQAKALRQQRQGTQMLGMQFNDLATSISTGASPITAFNQQIGQVGIAMSTMGGKLGAVGNFLIGPWGTALTIATMALGFLAEKFLFTGDEAEKASSKINDLGQQFDFAKMSAEDLNRVNELLAESNGKTAQTAIQAANATAIMASSNANAAAEALKLAKAELVKRQAILATMRAGDEQTGGSAADVLGSQVGQVMQSRRVAAQQAETERLSRLVEGFQFQTRKATAEVYALSSALDKSGRATELHESRVNMLRNAYASGQISLQRYREELDKANKAYEDSQESDKKKKKNSGLTAAEREARRFAKEQEKIAQHIADINIKADKAWRDYWTKAEEDQMIGLQEKLTDVQAMATATVDTVGESVGPIFLDRATEIQNAFASVGMAVNNAFKGMLTGAMSWKDGIKGIIGSVIDELWRLYVVQQIVGFVTKAIGGVTGNPGPNIDSAITVTRGRAVGGYVAAQTPYVVGEKGPELFVPGGSGTIIPNKNMGGAGGGTNGMVINVDARGASDPAAVRAQVQQGILEAAPAIIAAAQNRTVQGLRRPRLGGAMQ